MIYFVSGRHRHILRRPSRAQGQGHWTMVYLSTKELEELILNKLKHRKLTERGMCESYLKEMG
mgnify:CR=1 FL=1